MSSSISLQKIVAALSHPPGTVSPCLIAKVLLKRTIGASDIYVKFVTKKNYMSGFIRISLDMSSSIWLQKTVGALLSRPDLMKKTWNF